MKIKKRMATGVLAAVMALVTVFSVNTEYASAETVKQIRLVRGKEKKVQLDNKGDKEKILYTYAREKISYDKEEESTKYKIIFRLTIDGNTIIEETSTAEISDFREEMGDWKDMCTDSEVVITDIDRTDKRMDILVNTNTKGTYRIQYADGKVIVKENLVKMAKALDLPEVVWGRWGCYCTFSGTKPEIMQPYYKNGEWHYDKYKKNIPTIYQFTTEGDGTAKWAVCLDVEEIGYIHATIPLKLKNNKLKLATKSLSGDILETGYSGAVDKKMTVYTKAGGKKASFTVGKGNVLEFVSYRIIDNKVYIRVRNEKGKTGWISEKECKCLHFDGSLHMW